MGLATLVLQVGDSLVLVGLAWWLLRTGRGNHRDRDQPP